MSETSTSWRVDIAIIGPGEAHMVRIDDADGVADLCALIAYLRERRSAEAPAAAAQPTPSTAAAPGDAARFTPCQNAPTDRPRRMRL